MGISEGTQATDDQLWGPETPNFQADKEPLNKRLLKNCALITYNVQQDFVHGSMSSYRIWTILRPLYKLVHIFDSMGLPVANCKLIRNPEHDMFRREHPHCIEGTTGAATVYQYRKGKNIKTFTRGYNDVDYSVFKSAGLHDWLCLHGVRTLFLVGTDLQNAGVASAKEGRRLGYNVVIPTFANTSRDLRHDLDRTNQYLQPLVNNLGCKVI